MQRMDVLGQLSLQVSTLQKKLSGVQIARHREMRGIRSPLWEAMCPACASHLHGLGAAPPTNSLSLAVAKDKITESSHKGHISFILINFDSSEINILDQNRS